MSVIGGGDDLVAGLGIEGGDGHVDRSAARGAGDDVLDAEQLGERRLEGLGLRALGGRQHTALEDGGERGDLLGAERAAAGVLIRWQTDGGHVAPLMMWSESCGSHG